MIRQQRHKGLPLNTNIGPVSSAMALKAIADKDSPEANALESLFKTRTNKYITHDVWAANVAQAFAVELSAGGPLPLPLYSAVQQPKPPGPQGPQRPSVSLAQPNNTYTLPVLTGGGGGPRSGHVFVVKDLVRELDAIKTALVTPRPVSLSQQGSTGAFGDEGGSGHYGHKHKWLSLPPSEALSDADIATYVIRCAAVADRRVTDESVARSVAHFKRATHYIHGVMATLSQSDDAGDYMLSEMAMVIWLQVLTQLTMLGVIRLRPHEIGRRPALEESAEPTTTMTELVVV